MKTGCLPLQSSFIILPGDDLRTTAAKVRAAKMRHRRIFPNVATKAAVALLSANRSASPRGARAFA
jgi:hypothetical protein